MKKIIVTKKYDGKKLNTFILDNFRNLSQNNLYKALRKKDIRINNVKVSENTIVYAGDEITIYITDDLLLGENSNILDVVYNDKNIIIFNKPEGIAITENSNYEDNFANIVRKKYGNECKPCHRLDLNTSGLIIFSKNENANKILLEKFKNQEIEKHYKAKVYGILKDKQKIMEAYLFKDSKKNIVYISDTLKKDYVKIITEYKVIDENIEKNFSILDVTLHTGKTHQIRAHLAHIGYPIIGDGKYGKNEINKKFGKKTQELVAYKLIFKFKTDARDLNYLKNKEICLK